MDESNSEFAGVAYAGGKVVLTVTAPEGKLKQVIFAASLDDLATICDTLKRKCKAIRKADKEAKAAGAEAD